VTEPRADADALALEAFLARLYSDGAAYRAFVADAAGEAARAGLSPADVARVVAVDRAALALAVQSFAKKRARRQLLTRPADDM
jgi:hypothetical protein